MKSDEIDRWMERLLDYVRSGWPDLTNRQLAMVMLINRSDCPHTVRGVANFLRVSKPVITHALNTLRGHDFVRRERDENDRRSIFIRPTVAGGAFLDALAQKINSAAATDDRKKLVS